MPRDVVTILFVRSIRSIRSINILQQRVDARNVSFVILWLLAAAEGLHTRAAKCSFAHLKQAAAI